MTSPNLDYVEEYGDGGTAELLPTPLPDECANVTAGTSAYENIENARYLFQHEIINWPNFTHCLPNCGLCTQFASDHFYITYNLIVIGFLLPLVSLCGLCGNILSAFIYSRASLRQSYNGSLYLSALGCSDAAVIVTALFLFFLDSIRRHSLSLSIIYGSLSPIVYPAGMIAQTCSVYFTLVAGLDCFMQVYFPSKAKALLSTQRFRKASVSSVLIFSFVYNIPHCFESVLLDCWSQHFQSPSVELCPAPLRFHPTYTLIYYKYMYALFLAVGPLLILIILNTMVIIGTVMCKRGNSADNMALILVVLLFILCNTIALLINIFETHLSSALSWRINYIIDISNLLVVFNSSFNFVIYYHFSQPFRSAFLHHFCGKKSSSTVSAPTSPNCKECNGTIGAKVIPNNLIRSPLIGGVAQKGLYFHSAMNHTNKNNDNEEDEDEGPCWVKMEENGEERTRMMKKNRRSQKSNNKSQEDENCVWRKKSGQKDICGTKCQRQRAKNENEDDEEEGKEDGDVWKSPRYKDGDDEEQLGQKGGGALRKNGKRSIGSGEKNRRSRNKSSNEEELENGGIIEGGYSIVAV